MTNSERDHSLVDDALRLSRTFHGRPHSAESDPRSSPLYLQSTQNAKSVLRHPYDVVVALVNYMSQLAAHPYLQGTAKPYRHHHRQKTVGFYVELKVHEVLATISEARIEGHYKGVQAPLGSRKNEDSSAQQSVAYDYEPALAAPEISLLPEVIPGLKPGF